MKSIELIRSLVLCQPGDYESTMKDVFNIAYPDGGTTKVDGNSNRYYYKYRSNTDILSNRSAYVGGQSVSQEG